MVLASPATLPHGQTFSVPEFEVRSSLRQGRQLSALIWMQLWAISLRQPTIEETEIHVIGYQQTSVLSLRKIREYLPMGQG